MGDTKLKNDVREILSIVVKYRNIASYLSRGFYALQKTSYHNYPTEEQT